MKIAVIGTGYVGLVTGVMLAHEGHQVICLDIDVNKIDMLNRGEIPIYEPGLDQKVAAADSLEFTESYEKAIQGAQLVILAVGTPPKDDGSADLSYIYNAATTALEHDITVPLVIKSTVPPRTCLELQSYLRDRFNNDEVMVISNPEFLREGSAINDFEHPDRIVVGSDNAKGFKLMQELYSAFIARGVEIVETNQTTSELIKHASNSFLATKIGFINDMANLCEHVGADIDYLAKGIGLDKRIGSEFLKAGPGFGGSCFPKDISALAGRFHEYGEPSLLLDAVLKSNMIRPERLAHKIIKTMPIGVHNIAVFGLSFKANTDDVRQSPALSLIQALSKFGAKVVAYDPVAADTALSAMPNLQLAKDPYQAAQGASAVVIATEWEEFRELDYAKLKTLMKQAYIFDFRNLLDVQNLKDLGYKYNSIGK